MIFYKWNTFIVLLNLAVIDQQEIAIYRVVKEFNPNDPAPISKRNEGKRQKRAKSKLR